MNKYILPLIVLVIGIYGMFKKNNVYDSFIKGTKEGLEIGIGIFPSLLAIIFSTRILISSGFVSFLLQLISPVLDFIKFPKEVFPMAILRPISGNASLAMMESVFRMYGVDTYIGKLASTLQGCTDTTLYILTMYFGFVGVKKIKYSLYVGLLSDLIGIIASIIIVKLLF